MKRSLLLAATLALALAACDGSPTDPENRVLNGTYEGALDVTPSGENWSNVRLTVNTVGTAVTGTLVPKTGPTHPVTGQGLGGVYTLEVKELPQSTACDVTLIVNQIGAASIRGGVTGKCPNTLASTFRLDQR